MVWDGGLGGRVVDVQFRIGRDSNFDAVILDCVVAVVVPCVELWQAEASSYTIT